MFQETLADIQREAAEYSQDLITSTPVSAQDPSPSQKILFYGIALAPAAIALLVAAANLVDGPGGPVTQPWCPPRGGCTI